MSSQDIETVLRATGAWQPFRAGLAKLRRTSKKARLREQRADNVMVWRGLVTEPLPGGADVWRTVSASRRDVRIATLQSPAYWMDHDLAPGTRVLVDSRLRESDINAHEISVGRVSGEIIDTPHAGRRVHLWQCGRADHASAAAERSDGTSCRVLSAPLRN